jgi:hypothetical protein
VNDCWLDCNRYPSPTACQVAHRLEVQDCASRPLERCRQSYPSTRQYHLARLLDDLIAECGLSTPRLNVNVLFENGCATEIRDQPRTGRPDVVECLAAKLAGRRFGCALGLSCGALMRDTLR